MNYRKINSGIIISVILLSLFACEKDDATPAKKSTNIFPLKVGNQWQYDFILGEVTDSQVIDGKIYFEYQEKLSGVMNTFYYRKDNEGNVYLKKIKDKPEGLYLKVNLSPGQKWEYEQWESDGQITTWTCTVRDTAAIVEYNNNVFKNCYRVDYDVFEWVDEEHTKYFAPGIGMVKSRSYMWGVESLLSRSVIDGIEVVYIEE